MKIANDNHETFLPVGLHVNLILNRLRNERHLRELSDPEQERGEIVSPDEKNDQGKNEQDDERARLDLQRRIADILAMENRLRRKSIR